MIYGYARVSTEDQDAEMQVLALRQAGCKPGHIYADHGKSGSYIERPQLQKCLSKLKRDDLLVVWKLDRLARNTRDLLNTVEDLKQRGINFRSLTESIDTSSPTGTLIFQVFAAFAQFERSLIIERTAAGRTVARERGKKFGRKPSLTTHQKASALKLLAMGETCDRIAESFSVSRSTLYRALRALPRPTIAKPFKRKKPPSISDGEQLWQLVHASELEVIKVLELEYGQTQVEAVNYLIEETCWSQKMDAWTGGFGTTKQRRKALIEVASRQDLLALAEEEDQDDGLETLWMLALAADPEVFSLVDEDGLSITQAQAVDLLIEHPPAKDWMSDWVGGKGTPEERRAALIAVEPQIRAHREAFHEALKCLPGPCSDDDLEF